MAHIKNTETRCKITDKHSIKLSNILNNQSKNLFFTTKNVPYFCPKITSRIQSDFFVIQYCSLERNAIEHAYATRTLTSECQ